MSENIKKDLAQAKKSYQSKKYEEAKELYESLYMEHPDADSTAGHFTNFTLKTLKMKQTCLNPSIQ